MKIEDFMLALLHIPDRQFKMINYGTYSRRTKKIYAKNGEV